MTERVLVIDDSQDIRDFLVEHLLEPKGFEVLTAADGLMGLEMAISQEPDLMITDQQMPQLTGLEVLQKLRERNIDVPAILMTGQGSEETAVAAFRLGIRDYIIKPFDPDELSESIDSALRESRLERERDRLVQQLLESNSQLQRRAQELNVLYDVGKTVASSLDLEQVLQNVVEAAVFVVDAEEGSLMLLDEKRGELYTRASKNLDSRAQSTRKRVTDSLAGRVLQSQRAVTVGNQPRSERTHTALLVKSLIYVPLVWQRKAIGVLGVMNHLQERSFDSDDTRALSALAGYAAIAINNANIYDDIHRERNILSAIVEQNDDPVIVLDEEGRLLLLNAAARATFAQDVNNGQLNGTPVSRLLPQSDLVDFLTQPAPDLAQRETELRLNSGRSFKARLTVIEGGSRFLQLRELGE